jgi:hypothetical protein
MVRIIQVVLSTYRMGKAPERHSREGANPVFFNVFWTPACTGVTIQGTFRLASQHIFPVSIDKPHAVRTLTGGHS